MKRLITVLFLLATQAFGQQAVPGVEAELRVLDKVTGSVSDLTMPVGTMQEVGLLRVSLQECRAPKANPNGDAYALLSILYREDPDPVFFGWMIASTPALNAMDHPRYDVWVLRCKR